MNPKEQLKRVFEKNGPVADVPRWELAFHPYGKITSTSVALCGEFTVLSKAGQEKALNLNAEAMLDVSGEFRFAGLTVPSAYWEVAPGVPGPYWLPEKARLRQIEILRRANGKGPMLIAGVGGVLRIPDSHEYLDFSYKLFDAPEEIDALAESTLAAGLERARRLRDAGVEGFITCSDLADNHGPYFNPEQMQRFILPYLNRWAESIRALGGYAILHSDGNIFPLLDDLADSGVHALQSLDPVAGMDMRRAQEKIGGRVCLCGNIDCGLLLRGSPESVFEATRDLLLGCINGGGLVLGASNTVQQEVPVENYRALDSAWKSFGTGSSRPLG